MSIKETPTELYVKVQQGKRIRYEVYQPTTDDVELTEGQVLTIIAGALGVTVLTQYERCVPPHKRNARKIAAVNYAIQDLFRGSGQPLSQEMMDYVMNCWNKAVMTMSKGAPRI